MNRATVRLQKDLSQEEGLAPILAWVKALVDDVLAGEFDGADLEFAWAPTDPLDPQAQEQILASYTSRGILYEKASQRRRRANGKNPPQSGGRARAGLGLGQGADRRRARREFAGAQRSARPTGAGADPVELHGRAGRHRGRGA